MQARGSVHCMREGCGRVWPRDPALEVACPDCGAGVGHRCRRPSGHRLAKNTVHARRDLLADRSGCYGVCPFGRCGTVAAALEPTRPPPAPPLQLRLL